MVCVVYFGQSFRPLWLGVTWSVTLRPQNGLFNSIIYVGIESHCRADVRMAHQSLQNLGRNLARVPTTEPLAKRVHRQLDACLLCQLNDPPR